MLRHIGIANYLAYSDSNIQVKEVVDNCHAYGSVTTISFDMSLKETMLSLCNGLTLVFASDEQTVNPMLLAEFFKENNVDAFNSTPNQDFCSIWSLTNLQKQWQTARLYCRAEKNIPTSY